MNPFVPKCVNPAVADAPPAAALFAQLLLAAALGMPAIVVAQTVSDFKSASEKQGCASVPYAGKRSDCEGIQREIEANCKTDVIDCVGLYKTKADLIKSIENQKKEIGNIENKRAGLVKERDNYPKEQEAQIRSWNEKIKYVDEDIAKAKKALEETTGKLKSFDGDNKVVAGLERAQKCTENRKRSNTLFAAVMEDLYKEPTKTLGTTPGEGVTYNAQKRELEAYAVKIVDGIKKEIAGHTTAQADAENRALNCKKVIDLRL